MAPRKKRWFKPGVETGWSKGQSATYRRRLVLEAHKGDYLASGRAMQSLANVTRDPATKRLAGLDARYFFRMSKNKKKRER